MSDVTTTPTDETSAATDGDLRARFEGFQSRAKAEWALVEARARTEIAALPARLRQGATQALDRLRTGLDLPSRGEIAALSARIDELAAKLATYETVGRSRKAKDASA